MSFIRNFNVSKIDKLSKDDTKLFARLKSDVLAGIVFPAVRKEELHFYYKGGCLYRLVGNSFKRDPAFNKAEYSAGTTGLEPYEKAKKQCENKYTDVNGLSKEKQLLDKLNSQTFKTDRSTRVVVLDIEVRLNGAISGGKKCDMVLLNTATNQIMFVEGKLFKDNRVNVAVGFIPEVIRQVNIYTAGLAEQPFAIIEQYARHIRTVNELFCGDLPEKVTLIPTAKLLVYDTPKIPTVNGVYAKKTITDALGAENVMWVVTGSEPTLDEIWEILCK